MDTPNEAVNVNTFPEVDKVPDGKKIMFVDSEDNSGGTIQFEKLRNQIASDATDPIARAQIQNLAKLPEGSTTGDAELSDIRVGADGTQYPNAGAAVREQIKSAKKNADEAIASLKEDIDFVGNAVSNNLDLVLQGNKKYAEKTAVYPKGTKISCTPNTGYAMLITATANNQIIYDSGYKQNTITYVLDREASVLVRGVKSGFAEMAENEISNFDATIIKNVWGRINSIEEEVAKLKDNHEIDDVKKRVDEIESQFIKSISLELIGNKKYAENTIDFPKNTKVICTPQDGYAMLITVTSNNIKVFDSGYKNTTIEYTLENDASVMIRGVKNGFVEMEESDLINFSALESRDIWTKFDSLDEKIEDVKDMENTALSLFNPFASHPLYHHLNQESGSQSCVIPAQSLFDIHYAKELGFNMIEVNPQKCSDGVYVCKHGNGGKIGAGIKAVTGTTDYSDTAFSSVSSTWLRENIRYDTIEKYSGFIPTLDEVCEECKKLSMCIKVNSIETVEIARKHLPDDMIWSTQPSRGNFRGIIEYVWGTNLDIDNTIEICKKIKAPINIVVMAGQFASASDTIISELTQKAHDNGFTVGIVYPTKKDIVRAYNLGIDTIGAVSDEINSFTNGNFLNTYDLSDSCFSLVGGAIYNDDTDTIIMSTNSDVTINLDENVKSMKLSVMARYSGTIDFDGGVMVLKSDGSNYIPYCRVLQRKSGTSYNRLLNLHANTNCTIYEIIIHASKM